ncbi:MAG: M12 family metallo-peptidase [Phycisphaerales bacterium]|nr:M12 family metallo-peptidase [Phycisphaerales bacterium]
MPGRIATSATMGLAVITVSTVAFAVEVEPSKERFQPFKRFDHRLALLSDSQALDVDLAALSAARDTMDCTFENVPLGLIGEVDLELHRQQILAPDAQLLVVDKGGIERPIEGNQAAIWYGSVSGDPNSEVFFAESPAGVFGWISTAGDRWVLTSGDPLGDRTTVIYPSTGQANLLIQWSPFECGAKDVIDIGGHPGTMMPDDTGGVAGEECLDVDIAIDTDNGFLSRFGGSESAAQGYLETLLAAANIIYTRDANVQLSLVYSRLWSDTDPWSSSSSGGRLNEFQSYWQSQMSSVSRDTAHLISTDNLGGGIAWAIGAVCSNSSSYAVSGNLNGFFPTPLDTHSSQNWDPVVFTHELGHLFDSPHTHSYNPPIDGCGNGDCSEAFGGTIMSYCHLCSGGMNNIELGFHPTVQARMRSYLNSRPCVSDIDCVALDTDFDGIYDDSDNCPMDPNENQADSDQDGTGDACDNCPNDPLKTEPGLCGCGIPDSDSDGDGTPDCYDGAFDVPEDFATIELALEAAPDNAIINVAAGTWPASSTLHLEGRKITIRGATDGSLRPLSVITTEGNGTVFRCDSGEGLDTMFENLVISGGNGSIGGGMEISNNSSPMIVNCVFRDNTGNNGGGVYVRGSASSPQFWGCDFIDNTAAIRGGGAYVRQTSTPLFIGCVFARNASTSEGGGIANRGTALVDVSGTVFCGNSPDAIDGGWTDGGSNCFSDFCADSSGDGDPDSCSDEQPCDGDFNGNGEVEGADFGLLFAAWNSSDPTFDLNADGTVDGGDVGIFLSFWGPCDNP